MEKEAAHREALIRRIVAEIETVAFLSGGQRSAWDSLPRLLAEFAAEIKRQGGGGMSDTRFWIAAYATPAGELGTITLTVSEPIHIVVTEKLWKAAQAMVAEMNPGGSLLLALTPASEHVDTKP